MRAALLSLGVLFALAACGGPPRPSVPAGRGPVHRIAARSASSLAEHIVEEAPQPASDPGDLARELHVRCEPNQPCPDGVALLVRRESTESGADALQRCTATLVGPSRVLTSSHCLPPEHRRAGAGCEGTWLAFPSSGEHPLEWVACSSVVTADDVDDGRVLQSDLAVLELERALTRTTIPVERAPPDREIIVTVYAIRPDPIYDTQHELAVRRCRVATTSSAAASFGRAAADVGWLVECPSYPGNSGSPVLDARGRLRAVLHAGSHHHNAIAVMSAVESLPRCAVDGACAE